MSFRAEKSWFCHFLHHILSPLLGIPISWMLDLLHWFSNIHSSLLFSPFLSFWPIFWKSSLSSNLLDTLLFLNFKNPFLLTRYPIFMESWSFSRMQPPSFSGYWWIYFQTFSPVHILSPPSDPICLFISYGKVSQMSGEPQFVCSYLRMKH